MMSECQKYMEQYMPHIQDTISQTTSDWREHSFAFNQQAVSPIVLGDCDDVDKPTIESELGTFHTHTIDRSKPSEEDYELFMSTKDKYMCYAKPVDEMWNVRCYDRELSVCGETEVK